MSTERAMEELVERARRWDGDPPPDGAALRARVDARIQAGEVGPAAHGTGVALKVLVGGVGLAAAVLAWSLAPAATSEGVGTDAVSEGSGALRMHRSIGSENAIAGGVRAETAATAASTVAELSAPETEAPADPSSEGPEPPPREVTAHAPVANESPRATAPTRDAAPVARSSRVRNDGPAASRAQAAMPLADTLAEEALLLRKTQRALDQHAYAEARAALAKHESRFARGQLVELREVLAVELDCALDRVKSARARAARLRSKYGASPTLRRLRHSCAGDPRGAAEPAVGGPSSR